MTKLLTIDETADLIRLGKRTVERMIATGEIESIKMGRRRLVTEEAVERALRVAQRRGRVA